MSSIQRMKQALAALRLYRMTGESRVEQELESYQAGFALVEAALQSLEASAFLQSCPEEALGRWERLLRLPDGTGLPVENRREILLRKLAVSPADNSLAGIRSSLLAVGLDTRVEENPPLGELILTQGSILGQYGTLDALKRQVYAMLPAHLGAVFDIGVLTWELLDSKNLTFDDWDFTWEWLELNGEKLERREENAQ